MLETVIAGLILAAVSGLTFLAYKHPKGFDRLGKYLFWALIFAQGVSFAFVIGYKAGFEDGRNKEITVDKGQVSDVWFVWIFLGSFCVLAFLLFLQFGLLALTETDRKNNADKDEPPKGKSP